MPRKQQSQFCRCKNCHLYPSPGLYCDDCVEKHNKKVILVKQRRSFYPEKQHSFYPEKQHSIINPSQKCHHCGDYGISKDECFCSDCNLTTAYGFETYVNCKRCGGSGLEPQSKYCDGCQHDIFLEAFE